VPEYLHTWKPTMNKLGIPTNEKSMSGNPIGVMFQVTNVDPTRWTRSYSANSYLPLARRNLEVRTNSRVVKVEFAKKTPGKPLTATGVVLEDGKKVRAAREVILSAGVIGSPGLLELSGIGQTKVIRAAGIEPVLELAGVGENYQDHIRSSNSYRLKKNFTSFDPLIYENTGAFAQQQLQLWLDGKYSWLDYTSSAYSFLNWDQIAGNSSSDLVALAKRVSSSDNSVAKRRTLEMLRDRSIPQAEIVMESNYVGVKGYPGGNFITIIYTVMHPLSRGYVHIDAANPLGKPIIDPRYMSNEYDIRAMVEIAKFSRKIAETEPMASVWEEEYEPGPGVRTDAQWRDFARNSTQSFFHPMGTCAMLPRKDGGVVDSSLVVHETSNLRVVDCSIIPVLLSAHPQTAAHGIAEIAAAMIIRKDRDHGHGGNSSDE
jgi:choline dehydrogenase-like flavoprotein